MGVAVHGGGVLGKGHAEADGDFVEIHKLSPFGSILIAGFGVICKNMGRNCVRQGYINFVFSCGFYAPFREKAGFYSLKNFFEPVEKARPAYQIEESKQ